ncbi:MAG: hypothetical protein KDA96_15690 [Planctomycetaceae bacterium]|nr:hypothetical protein [Planctomycetaceae bacterium]
MTTTLKNSADTEEVGDIEISEEMLARRLKGTDEEKPSVLAMRESLGGAPTIAEQLQQEMVPADDPGGSMPVLPMQSGAAKEMWTIEIHEGKNVRLEAIETSAPAPKASQGNFWDFLKGPSPNPADQSAGHPELNEAEITG